MRGGGAYSRFRLRARTLMIREISLATRKERVTRTPSVVAGDFTGPRPASARTHGDRQDPEGGNRPYNCSSGHPCGPTGAIGTRPAGRGSWSLCGEPVMASDGAAQGL